MESDLSLIEIAGEDDSLLLEVEDTSTTCFFSCSPLQIPGSNRPSPTSTIVGLRHNANVGKPTCSSPKGSRNKENVNVNKSEVPKLSVDPQQMKRRKRGGTCSLRKSLAWDKAFFTEEGVLNPLELSMLSGRFGNSSGDVLPTIQEDGIKLSSNNSSTSDSADLQVHEENLSKKTPTSMGTPKILSNQRSNRTGSKSGGCPRPLVFSSLKRPANASTTKAAMKESKLPKIPVSRSCVHSLPKSNKSNVLSTSHLKDNQIGQEDTVQKSARLQGSFKTTKSTTNKAKAGSDSLSLSAESSLRQPRRNMANSVLEVHPLTNPQNPLVMKAKRGLEAFPATVLPPTGSRAPDVHDLPGKTGVLLTQNSWCVSGNLPYTKFQTTKPSGLRMPSPSLGFFGQTKYSASNSSTQKATHKVCRSSFKGYSDIQMNENNCILQSGSSNQLKKDGNYGMTIGCPEFRDSNMNDLETTNFASQRSCTVDKWNLKKAELTNAFAYEPDQIPQGENHNLIRNDGFSLEDRKALESQNYKGDNVANVNSNICLSDGSEKLSCNSPPHESGEKAKEGAAGVDQLRERLHGKDVQVHFVDETLLFKNYENKLHTSKVNEKFEEDLKLQSCCLLDEPNVITQDPGVVQDDGADTYDMIEELQVKASNSADIVPPVENRMTGAVTSCNFMAFCSPSKEEDIRSLEANGLKNNILAEKAESKVSLDNPHDENERIKINGDTLSEKRRFSDEFDAGDLVNTVDVHIINQGSSGSELKICQIASLLESTEQANKDTARTDMMTNELFEGDANVQSLNDNLLFGNSNCGQIHSVMDSQCLMVLTDINGQAGGEPGLQTRSLVFDHIVQDNHDLNFNDYLLHGKSTDYEEPREEKVLSNVSIVQEHSDVDGSEINSSIVVIQVPMPLSMQDSGDDVEGLPEHQLAEYAPSDSVIIGTSSEHDKHSIEIHHGNDMGFSAQAMSSEFVVTNEELFSIEESGLAVHKIQILANEANAVAEVDKMNIILPDDIEVGHYQKNASPTGDLQHRMDRAICHTEKEGTTMLINKSEDGGEQNNLMIKPPVNAVPFSDEWLAAIESAGEEILTMKSGAVQNSPTDKSLPEPGPWSPVKRKQGQIGPFDCTKFINIAPPDSD